MINAHEFEPQAQVPSTHERDEFAAHLHEALHSEPLLPEEHDDAEPVPLFELHESTMLKLKTHANAKNIANL